MIAPASSTVNVRRAEPSVNGAPLALVVGPEGRSRTLELRYRHAPGLRVELAPDGASSSATVESEQTPSTAGHA